MKKSIGKRLLSLCLVLAVVFSFGILPAQAAATSLSDIKGNRAETAIRAGVAAGYISGYSDGTFKPNRTVTRAQFSKMLNQAIGLTNTVSINFSDVPTTAWCYNEIRKAVSAQYITGYENGTFKPDNTITRLQAAVMLSRVVTRPATLSSSTKLSDSAKIPDWARDSVDVIYTKGYLKWDSTTKFNPYASVTRAQAAQMIYLLLKGETIVSASTELTTAGSRSGTLYANNLTLGASLGGGSVSLTNCRVLGALAVSGGSDVTLSGTTVNYLAAASEGAKIVATGNSTVKDTVVRQGSTLQEAGLSGEGFQKVTLSGSDLESSTVKLDGTFDKVVVQDSTVLQHSGGDITVLEVAARSSTAVQKGTITALDVDASAANSTVTLAKGVAVGTATMNGAASFYGEGSIARAVENVSGVTYETQPGSITTGSGVSVTGSLTPTVTPANGTAGVSTSAEITLTFDDVLFDTFGSTLTTSYVEGSAVELRQGGSSGTLVSYTASVSSDHRTIVIRPNSALVFGVTYAVTVKAGTLKNINGTYNSSYTSLFTAGTAAGGVVFTPAGSATGVAVSSSISIAFPSAIYRTGYTSLKTSYLEGTAIEVRSGSLSGTKVDFTAAVSSDGKTVILTPVSTLSTGTRYYVTVLSGTLQYASGTAVSTVSSSFTTEDSASPITISTGSVSANSASFSVRTTAVGKLTVQYSGGGSTTTLVSGIMTTANSSRSFSLSDLKVGTTYTISVSFVRDGQTYTKSQSFTTTSAAVNASIKEMQLVDGSDVYSIIDSSSNTSSTVYTVNPAATTGAKITILPAETSVASVEYRISSSSSNYTSLSRNSSGYYTISNLSYAKGQTLTLEIRITPQSGGSARTYTVNIVCNY